MNRQRIHLMYQSSADWLSLFKRQTDLKFISICATFIYRRYDGSETSSTVRLKPIRQVEIWLWIANWSEEIILRGSFDHMQVLTTNQLSFLFHLHEPQSFINPPLHIWPSSHKKKKKKKDVYLVNFRISGTLLHNVQKRLMRKCEFLCVCLFYSKTWKNFAETIWENMLNKPSF